VSAPARIDLAGGTLDIPPLCWFLPETVTLNLAIDLDVSVILEPADDFLVRSDDQPPQPMHTAPLFAETLRWFGCREPFAARIRNRIPRASGLGGSSSLLTALVQATARRERGRPLAPEALLDVVTLLEHRLLGKPAGVQDAIAAMYGGLSAISFESGRAVRAAAPLPAFLKGPLYLAYSPIQHHSGLNNWGIVKAACEADPGAMAALRDLAANARRMLAAIQHHDRGRFLESLADEARLRRRLSDSLMTDDMRQFAAAFGQRLVCKVCGAGGGGCMFLFGDDLDAEELAQTADRFGLQLLQTAPRAHGCLEDGS